MKKIKFPEVFFNPIYAASVAGHLKSLGLDAQKDILGKTDFEVYPKELAEEYFIEDQSVIRDGQSRLYGKNQE